MDRLHDVARLLISSLVLAGDENVKRIPTSHGLLDKAIHDSLQQFPTWAREQIHMADSRIGLQCVELPEILGWAQASELTSAPNPYYREMELNASPYVAKVLLKRLGIDEADARRLGEGILRSISASKQQTNEPLEVGGTVDR
jgi:hypothetical protein